MTRTVVEHLNPEGLHANPAFSQAVAVEGPHRLVVVGGQNAVDAGGTIVGAGDLAAQTEQALANLETALAAGGAELGHVIKWTIYLVAGPDGVDPAAADAAFGVAMKRLAALERPPAISVLHVAGLAHPDFLIEIEALAAVPR